MEISPACLPPIQPSITVKARKHPRFEEYLNYRSSMAAQLVTASNFDVWLKETIERESSKEVVFQVTDPSAELSLGWYKHQFAPGLKLVARYGPFGSKDEAKQAS
jgi:hypothetical protein